MDKKNEAPAEGISSANQDGIKCEIPDVNKENVDLTLIQNPLSDEVQKDVLEPPKSRPASLKQIPQQPEEQQNLSTRAPDADFDENDSTDSEIATESINSNVPTRVTATVADPIRTLSTKRGNQSSPFILILVVVACCVFYSMLSQQVGSNLVTPYFRFKLDDFRFTRSSLTH